MKRIVKILSVLVCLGLILALSGCQGEASVTVAGGQITATPGGEVTVPITITADSKVAAADVLVRFDDKKLAYMGYDDSDVFDPDMKVGNLEAENRFHYTLATLNSYTEAGTVFSLTFRVADDAKGTIPLKIEVPTLVDADHNVLSCKIEHGKITVE